MTGTSSSYTYSEYPIEEAVLASIMRLSNSFQWLSELFGTENSSQLKSDPQ